MNDISGCSENVRLTNWDLYKQQIELLKTFLENGAITQAQYDKSSGDLAVKMKLPRKEG